MDIEKLNTFVTVARMGSLSAAAESMFLTVSAVSKHITHLEESFSTVLLRRNSHGVELTESGRLLLRHAKIILANYEEMLKAMNRMEDNAAVQIKAIPIGEMIGLLDLIAAFENDCPGIPLCLQDIHGQDVNRVLSNLQAEIVFCTDKVIDASVAVYAELFRSRYILLVCTSHPLAQRDTVSIHDLAGESFISLPEHTGVVSTVKRMCREVGFEYNVTFYSERESNIVSMVGMNMGIAVVDTTYLTKDFIRYYGGGKVKVLNLKEDFSCAFVIARPKNQPLTPNAQAFWEYTLKQLNEGHGFKRPDDLIYRQNDHFTNS